MRKILSLITALVLCTTFVSATTIYCKMAQGWWKTDNAAVGCHSWGTPGPGTTWPGVRMTPVEGETDLWSIELDTDKVQNVIFTRVNPSGAIADWGAKTKDLQIPTNGDNLFTITTSSESWGDPGCDGTWSVYGGAVDKPKHDYTITAYLPEFCDDIAAYADSVRVMGGFDDWSNGIWMEKKIDEDFNEYWYAEIYNVEEGTAFKLRFGTDADWKVQVQLNGANMANEAFGETTDIVLHYDGEGYGFAACAAPAARKEFVFVAGEAADSDPALFAITWGKDGSSEQVKMEKQEEALYAADILATVDSVVLVRCATDATEIIWDGEGKNVWNQTANYALCDTMYFGEWTEDGLFTLTCEAPKPIETKYYAKNNWNGATEWSWLEMSATDQENFYMLDSVVFGGTGVNINDKEDDTDALWFAADAITVLDGLDGLPGPIPPKPQGRDTIPYAPAHSGVVLEAPQLLAGDTIKLFFNAADSTLTAFILGRPTPPTPKYYVTGNDALVGAEKAWQADAIEMVDYTHTFPMLAAGEYQLKVTDGTWAHAWGYDNLSPTVAVEGLYTDVDGNICFTVYTPNDVTVTFAQGYVVVTGDFKESPVETGITVNVTVPEGTPACFFYGEMSGNTFAEMTKVDETHYTIDFPKATTIGWGYLFVWENGNWNTKNADPEGDIKVEPVEGVINVEIKAWVTAPGTEYKYTTYTEWQVKYGPAWEWVNMTKQEDGTFTVEAVWGNTGINIASGENPIKQDWYPLDDAALAVAEDVVEGDNVVITLTVVNDNTVALNVAKKVTTNISNVKGQNGQRYNILGQPVNETYRGLVIMNGQTFLQK